MSYQALYNKYRPQSFEEVVGQKSIVTTLLNAIKENKVAHAYLFCGPKGTGKTTVARLFAKALNCLEGLGHQCNKCESCIKIKESSHPDVYELDAASNSSVEDVRDIIERLDYAPVMSRYKVYIIDEVHNMSTSAFNALLKSIEEPPKFTVFILATTEPQQLIGTILSRVQRFDFSKVSQEDLIKNMDRILKKEKIEYEKGVLEIISQQADGGVRDSLSLLDKCISYCTNKITLKDVEQLLGLFSLKDKLSIVENIHEKNSKEIIKMLREKYSQGLDISLLENDLVKIYKDFILYKITGDVSLLQYLDKMNVNKINISLDEAQNNIKALINCIKENRYSSDILTDLELAIVSLTNPIQTIEASTISSDINVKDSLELESVKPVEILSSSSLSGKEFKNSADDSDESITYTKDQIFFLMSHGDKEKRVQLNKDWPILSDATMFDSNTARLLSTGKCNILAKGIMIITLNSKVYAAKYIKKNKQKELMDIIKKAFNIDVNVLVLSNEEFKSLAGEFDPKREYVVYNPIKFLDEKDNAASDFFNSVLSRGEK